MTKEEYLAYVGDPAFMQTTKAEYEALLDKPLLMEVDNNPRLTKEGIIVCEYGVEMSMNQPELSTDQQQQVIMQHFPEALRKQDRESLEAAVGYYQSSLLFSDEELGEV